VGFADTWIRQVLGAAGASLLVPAVLLGVAGVIAASSGLGGLSSLGQIGSGPALPSPDHASADALGDADIVGADLASPELASSAAGDGTVAATGGPPAGSTPAAPLPSPLTGGSPVGGGGGEGFDAPDGPGGAVPLPLGGGGDGATPAPGGPTDIVGPGGLAEEVTQPIEPVTDTVIDLLSPDR
jgi:hypothetical protein